MSNAAEKPDYPPHIEAPPRMLEATFGDFQAPRDAWQIGDVRLSVQASRRRYSEPRANGLPLSEYSSVEIALVHDGELVTPEQIGIAGLPGHWKHDTVARYVSHAEVAEIVRQLSERQPLPTA